MPVRFTGFSGNQRNVRLRSDTRKNRVRYVLSGNDGRSASSRNQQGRENQLRFSNWKKWSNRSCFLTIEYFDRHMVLIKKLAERTVMIGVDRICLIFRCRRRMRMAMAATGRVMTVVRLGTMNVQTQEMGAMQRRPHVQQ